MLSQDVERMASVHPMPGRSGGPAANGPSQKTHAQAALPPVLPASYCQCSYSLISLVETRSSSICSRVNGNGCHALAE